ncbi:DUF7426 family protein [Xylanimonas ulmi]|uniref:DUF7426 domain-containing protein n=1 Tax=Xylanimonas ulmi TaxID=228973 RepID=A0A4Q7M6I9_9MICO|nr:hypothetical protein [Xylanibacterium ulmi]RZS61689.1 hypothetical protein EV386_1999 [Xylanibacterium ulmi]
MDLSGLTEHLAAVTDEASLRLPVGGRTYDVRPPDLAREARCWALWATRKIEDPERLQKAADEVLAGDSLHVLALGRDVVDEMTEDGVPGVLIRELGNVALVAWCLGPAAAQQYVDSLTASAEDGEESGEA